MADAGLVLRMRNRISALQSELSRTQKRASDLEDRIMSKTFLLSLTVSVTGFRVPTVRITKTEPLQDHRVPVFRFSQAIFFEFTEPILLKFAIQLSFCRYWMCGHFWWKYKSSKHFLFNYTYRMKGLTVGLKICRCYFICARTEHTILKKI